jgi:mannose-6-phosphate isomerase-like protein (cupin superfamily)
MENLLKASKQPCNTIKKENIMETVNLAEKLAHFSTHWDPHVVADYNENEVMVVKFIGEYPFHKHDTTDDFFYVLEGEMEIDIEGEEPRTVKAGELFIVPKGVVHRPRAKSEVKVLLIEPKGEPNSGDSDREAAPKTRI